MVFAMCVFYSFANAQEFFQDCDEVANGSDYRLLNEYFVLKGEAPDHCQRLDGHEFLYTTSSNIFYCKSVDGASLKCEENVRGHWFPDLSIVKKFRGGKGKQFVLFRVRHLSHGNFGEGYHVFFLMPKKITPRGYTVFFFRDAGAANLNGIDGACADTDGSEAVTSREPPVEIINENKTNVVVRFNQERTKCKTGARSKQTLEYTWQNNSFNLTKNKMVRLRSARRDTREN